MEVVLILMMGFSPGGASGANMRQSEHVQVSMELCELAAKDLETRNKTGFYTRAMCLTRVKG